jgi:transposase-like protein
MKKRVRKRYSTAFKRKVVREVETGTLSVSQAQKIYDIGGGSTIYNWLDEFGKSESKTVYVQTNDETDPMSTLEEENKRLREEKQALESALAQAHLKQLALESTIEVASEHFGTDVKKNFGTEASKRPSSGAPSAENFSSNESPNNESPSNESPSNESPSNESPSNESPSNESPNKESPNKESPNKEST